MPVEVGVIGLGLVGSALVERLLAAGMPVYGYDVDQDKRQAIEAFAAQPTGSAAEIATHCRRFVLSLPTTAVVESVLEEMEGQLRPGDLVVDTTTGAPERTARVAARLAKREVAYVDATILGSSAQVRAGEVVVMAGGEAAAFEQAQPILASFAGRVFHVGPAGGGARMKLVVNLVLGLNRAVLAEGLAFARQLGIDGRQALEVLKAGAAYSRAMDTKGAKMLDREFTPEARLSQHLKDVRLILAEAVEAGARVPLSAVHRVLLEEAEAAGYGERDNSAVICAYEPEEPLK